MATATKARTKAAEVETTSQDPATSTELKVTGYDTDVRLFATRYKQGGRTVYSLDLSPAQIVNLIPAPNPDVKTPGNRSIRKKHAGDFARYLRENQSWVVPGMILRAPGIFNFDMEYEVEGTQFGIISFPRLKLMDIHILDGQHRILGFHIAVETLSADLDTARNNLATARRVDPKSGAVRQAQARIKELDGQRDRLDSERVSLQIFVEQDMAAYRQMFFDIADNALGITASVKSRFDTRKVVNRALESVLEHPLLANRVDLEADRIGRGSIYLMGAKHVADITRTVTVGLEGRVTRGKDMELKEADIAYAAKTFLDDMVESFPPLKAVTVGQLMPDDLRKTSVLGSMLMERILAGVYYELVKNHAFNDQMVIEYFSKLAPHMGAPVHRNSIWMMQLPENVFTEGTAAPHGRRQDIKFLRDTLVNWAIDKPKFLDEEPLPRPEPVDDSDPLEGAGNKPNPLELLAELEDK